MFWNKIFKLNVWGRPVYRTRNGNYNILAEHEGVQDGFNHINQKLDLILNHLNLEYVPETEKKEPAKLVEKKDILMEDIRCTAKLYPSIIPNIIWQDSDTTQANKPKKKKRGLPKKK